MARHQSRRAQPVLLLGGVLLTIIFLSLVLATCRPADREETEPSPSVPQSTVPAAPIPAGARYISPAATGNGSGDSEQNAAPLARLGDQVARAGAGGFVAVLGNRGVYELDRAVPVSAGGTPDRPVTVRGIADAAGRKPLIRSNRTSPYARDGVPGSEAITLKSGASDLVFENLDAENIGNGVFVFQGSTSGIRIQDMAVKNVRRFVETGDGDGVAGLVVRNVSVRGFSKGAIRLGESSRDVLIENVDGDSERQDGDNFAIGVHLEDQVRDVRLVDVTMRNCWDSTNEYWNGDGFATESGVRRVVFDRAVASGNTDGGFDLKSAETRVENSEAVGNKRNYRIWARDTDIRNCRGADPVKSGGSGSAAQVQLNDNALVRIDGCRFSDSNASAATFDVPRGSEVFANRTYVENQRSLSTVFGPEAGAVIVDGKRLGSQ